MKVLIIAGHGTETPGKRSPDGQLREGRYCREIAQRVSRELTLRGADAILIVPEDADTPLTERVRRVNKWCNKLGKDNVLLIEIHCNAAGKGNQWLNARGWSAYTTIGKTKADLLATSLYHAAEKYLPGHRLRCDTRDGDPDIEENFYVIKHTLCPAVLTENLFQDNRRDVDFLLSPKGKEAITMLHVEGIINYIKSCKKQQ